MIFGTSTANKEEPELFRTVPRSQGWGGGLGENVRYRYRWYQYLGMKIYGDYVREASLNAHLGNELERDVATSPHFGLLAVRQAWQHA